jgi:hypothetical protein
MGLVHDYDNNWNVAAFVFSYSWPHTHVWYIFHMDLQCHFIGSHVCSGIMYLYFSFIAIWVNFSFWRVNTQY